jgi:hypothetical protein
MKSRRLLILALITTLLFAFHCKEKKQLAVAKGNAVEFSKARCACEKQKKKSPPGDLTKCSEDMARATRYLKINFEFNNFSDEAKREITKAGDEAFAKCMAAS